MKLETRNKILQFAGAIMLALILVLIMYFVNKNEQFDVTTDTPSITTTANTNPTVPPFDNTF